MRSINPKSTTKFLLTAALCVFLSSSPPTALCEEEVDAKCYSPNGDIQIQDVPCNASASAGGGVSFCCGRGFTCLSNKMCMLSQDTSTGDVTRVGSTYRASCTDKSWNSTECPSFCAAKTNSINNQATSSCGNHSWCCQAETANAPYCCTGNDTFTTDPVNDNQVVIPAFPSTSNSSSSSFSSAGSTSKPTSSSHTTIISSSTSTSTPINLPLSSSSGRKNSQTIALGVGLGIPLAIALAAALFFVMRSRARRPDPAKVEEIDSSTGSYWVAEVPGQKEYELPVEPVMPAEMYAKPG